MRGYWKADRSPSPPPKQARAAHAGPNWACVRCTFSNVAVDTVCIMCQMPAESGKFLEWWLRSC